MSESLRKKSFWLLLPALLITAGFLPHLLDMIKADAPVDTDNDGLADPWEITHFGDLVSQDGDGDPDGDGYFNVEEESLGTDPNIHGGIPGYLSHDVWTGIGGVQVGDLISHTKFHQTPDISELILGSSVSLNADNYGSRLRGTITAPVTGSYTFWIAGDDGVEFWLSSDDRKFNRQRLAWHTGYTAPNQWDKFATQQSAPVCLIAGQKYYLEALHKEGYGGNHLSIAWSYEADDLKNWARESGAVASQSSEYYPSPGPASKAVDGSRDGVYAHGSVTHTLNQDDSWWQIDLGAPRSVERILIFNRADCCQERLSNFRISVLDASGVEIVGQDYHTVAGYVDGSLVWDLVAPVIGSTVKISLLGKSLVNSGVLSLAEVEVMGSASGAGNATPLGYLTNWTQEAGVTATQSAEYLPSPGPAGRAIDGDRNGHYPSGGVTHTSATHPDNWWQADLGADRPVSRIVIYNRTDCCMERLSNFRVSLLDASGASIVQKDFYPTEGHVGYQLKWDVPLGTSASVVRIDRLGPARDGSLVLSLAEVEVLGNQNLIQGAILARQPIPTSVLESYPIDPDDPDDDGLPSAWEIQYGFDPNSAQGSGGGSFGDPDNDLLPNWREYQLGTNPVTGTSLTGALTEEVWTGISGDNLSRLYEHPKYLLGSDYRRLIYQSEGTRWLGSNTGARIRGYLTPPITGDYRFWLSGNDEVAFWLSNSEDKFAKELLIHPALTSEFRSYDVESSQQSRIVHLVVGQKYFLEIHFKEGGGGGSSPASLAWQPPGGQRGLIPAEQLSSYAPHANDLDDDNLPDDWETANGLDPTDNGSIDPVNGANGDLDGDGLDNQEEYAAGTRADLTDTDGDGVSDYDEVKTLETAALTGDVAPFQPVQTLNGSAYTASYGGWSSDGAKAYGTGVRGWVEYQLNVPAEGLYLLDLSMEPRIGGTLSDQYELIFSVDGHFVSRVTTVVDAGNTGNAKALTPWLTAGNHTVRIFNDNALTFRKSNFLSLSLLSAQGSDLDSNGRPDWVDARLERLNGIDTRKTESRVSPLSVEGRARFPELMSIPSGLTTTPSAGERWAVDVDLDPQSPVNLHMTFENGALVRNQQIKWTETNLLAETSITLRQGDSMLLTAFNGQSGSGSENVTLVVEGQTYSFSANNPHQHSFDNPGTHTLDVTWNKKNQTLQHSVTVTVVAPLTLESPVCVPAQVREWDIPTLPAGAILEMDERIEIRDVIDLGNGTTRYLINTESPETRYGNVRLGMDGSILQSIAVRGLVLRDAEDTSMQFIEDFGDGSYQVDMPVVLSTVHEDIRVHYNIFVGGVIFDTGGIDKDYLPANFDDLGQARVTFIKTGTQGSACHRTSIWQGNKRIAWYR